MKKNKKKVAVRKKGSETKTEKKIVSKKSEKKAVKKKTTKKAEKKTPLTYAEMKLRKNYIQDFCEKVAKGMREQIIQKSVLTMGVQFVYTQKYPIELFEDILKYLQYDEASIFDFINEYNTFHFNNTEEYREKEIEVSNQLFKRVA